MGMITSALNDFRKNIFSPKALLTGGLSLAVSGTKAGIKSMKPAAAVAAAAPKQDSQPAASEGAAKARPGGAVASTSGTLLTGPAGVDASTLNLGRNKLLGQ